MSEDLDGVMLELGKMENSPFPNPERNIAKIAGGLVPDRWIKKLVENNKMIEPFVDAQARDGVISYGLSSYGYDIRVSSEFKIFTNVHSVLVDPKNFNSKSFVDIDVSKMKSQMVDPRMNNVAIIPPNSFALAKSVEYFRIPDNITGLVLGKSTYARCGIVTNFTPLEAGWEGYITIEISNTTPLPAKIYANEGIAQVLFFCGFDCETTYRDKKGKYQGQTGITLPKID